VILRRPELVHLATQRRIMLRHGGMTTFGRAPGFHNYLENDSVRWSKNLATELESCDYVWIAENFALSRTHGRIIHEGASDTVIYEDLKSKNGTTVNFREISNSGYEGTFKMEGSVSQPADNLPTVLLHHGDTLTMGDESFRFELVPDVDELLSQQRCALLVDGNGGCASESFEGALRLLEHKGLRKDHVDLVDSSGGGSVVEGYRRALQVLVRKKAQAEGFVLIYLKGSIENDCLHFNSELVESPESLLRSLNGIPGAKVVLLEVDQSAEAFEDALRRTGFRDTLLVTALRGNSGDRNEAGETVNPAGASGHMSMRVDEESPGTFRVGERDGLDEVLDALLDPSSTKLRMDVVAPYRSLEVERLHFVLGEQMRDASSFRGVFHTLDFDLGSSLTYSVRNFYQEGAHGLDVSLRSRRDEFGL